MQAIDVMQREVVAVGPDDTVIDAARRMIDHRLSGLPVIGARGRLVGFGGIVTRGDLMRALVGFGGARAGDLRTVEYR
jgi:CBS domain-containing protein